MIVEGVKMDGETAAGGEIESERIPTRMIEARSKDLLPVFDYLQTPVFQPTRWEDFSMHPFIYLHGICLISFLFVASSKHEGKVNIALHELVSCLMQGCCCE